MKENILFAPLEGITGVVFRRTFQNYFPGVDEYYSPFLTPKLKIGLDKKDRKEIDPEKNEGMKLIPQILSSDSAAFSFVARELRLYGYEEINLNLGCPSGTVVNKGRGAGALKNLDSLHELLSGIFNFSEKEGIKISLKTRLGYARAEEFEDLLQVFKVYPFSKLILHPRTRMEFYKGEIHRESFLQAMDTFSEKEESLCFNGDIFTYEDYISIKKEFPKLSQIMIGRGFLKNPFLLAQISGKLSENKKERKARLFSFLQELFSSYLEDSGNERVAVLKMKEMWTYLASSFFDKENLIKDIRKARNGAEYRAAVTAVFSACTFLS